MKEEAEFFAGLLEWNYGQKDFSKLKNLAQKVSWAQGWPEEKKAFWNAEAFMWQRKIAKEKRALIENELQSLSLSSKSGKNLDLGCGSYSYLLSVGFDFSAKMLQFNSRCTEKISGDLERKLPLPLSSS